MDVMPKAAAARKPRARKKTTRPVPPKVSAPALSPMSDERLQRLPDPLRGVVLERLEGRRSMVTAVLVDSRPSRLTVDIVNRRD